MNMPEISLGEAATLAGVSRPTMWRLVKAGKLSASRNERGAWMIDASEFARVFPNAHSSQNSSENSDEKPLEQSALATETQVLREALAELKADKAKLNERLDQAERERERLLKLIESQTDQMRLLTDQRPARRPWLPWRRS
jgi:uncharacterized protein YlxW (UPF0749 family)